MESSSSLLLKPVDNIQDNFSLTIEIPSIKQIRYVTFYTLQISFKGK